MSASFFVVVVSFVVVVVVVIGVGIGIGIAVVTVIIDYAWIFRVLERRRHVLLGRDRRDREAARRFIGGMGFGMGLGKIWDAVAAAWGFCINVYCKPKEWWRSINFLVLFVVNFSFYMQN